MCFEETEWFKFYKPILNTDFFQYEEKDFIEEKYNDIIKEQYEIDKNDKKCKNIEDFMEEYFSELPIELRSEYYSLISKKKKKLPDKYIEDIKKFPVYEKYYREYTEKYFKNQTIIQALLTGFQIEKNQSLALAIFYALEHTDENSTKYLEDFSSNLQKAIQIDKSEQEAIIEEFIDN